MTKSKHESFCWDGNWGNGVGELLVENPTSGDLTTAQHDFNHLHSRYKPLSLNPIWCSYKNNWKHLRSLIFLEDFAQLILLAALYKDITRPTETFHNPRVFREIKDTIGHSFLHNCRALWSHGRSTGLKFVDSSTWDESPLTKYVRHKAGRQTRAFDKSWGISASVLNTLITFGLHG